MSECSLISHPLIPLSASGVASKHCVCVCWAHFGINSDNLQASSYTSLQFYQIMYISFIACLIKLLQPLLETTAQCYAKLEHLCFTQYCIDIN